MANTSPQPLLVSVPAAAAMIGCSRSTFYKLLADGRVRAVKLGNRTLIRVQSLQEFAAALPDMQPMPPS